jgi:hypothetical protein
MSSQLQADVKRIPVRHDGLTKHWTMAILLRAAGNFAAQHAASIAALSVMSTCIPAHMLPKNGCLCVLCRFSMLLVDPLGHMGCFNDRRHARNCFVSGMHAAKGHTAPMLVDELVACLTSAISHHCHWSSTTRTTCPHRSVCRQIAQAEASANPYDRVT